MSRPPPGWSAAGWGFRRMGPQPVRGTPAGACDESTGLIAYQPLGPSNGVKTARSIIAHTFTSRSVGAGGGRDAELGPGVHAGRRKLGKRPVTLRACAEIEQNKNFCVVSKPGARLICSLDGVQQVQGVACIGDHPARNCCQPESAFASRSCVGRRHRRRRRTNLPWQGPSLRQKSRSPQLFCKRLGRRIHFVCVWIVSLEAGKIADRTGWKDCWRSGCVREHGGVRRRGGRGKQPNA